MVVCRSSPILLTVTSIHSTVKGERARDLMEECAGKVSMHFGWSLSTVEACKVVMSPLSGGC